VFQKRTRAARPDIVSCYTRSFLSRDDKLHQIVNFSGRFLFPGMPPIIACHSQFSKGNVLRVHMTSHCTCDLFKLESRPLVRDPENTLGGRHGHLSAQHRLTAQAQWRLSLRRSSPVSVKAARFLIMRADVPTTVLQTHRPHFLTRYPYPAALADDIEDIL
jgi:hypothetical protein